MNEEILFSMYQKKIKNVLNGYLPNLKKIDVHHKEIIKLYYENIFLEMVSLNLFKYIDNVDYSNNRFTLNKTNVLQMYIDITDDYLYKIILFNPNDSLVYHMYEVPPDDNLIIQKLQSICNRILYYYDTF